jgi:hypothetical protein
MPRTVVIVFLSFAIWMGCLSVSAMALDESLLALYRTRVQDKVADLAISRAVLESKDQAAWTPEEVQAYLHDSIWAICNGLTMYEYEYRRMPDKLSDMAGTEYAPVWPGNPYADWAPMEVLSVADGFKAGCFVLQVCPPEFYSNIKNPRPLSYELGIYGPDIEFASCNSVKPNDHNTWATIPEGVYEMIGGYTETTVSLRKKWARMKQQQKAEDIQNW